MPKSTRILSFTPLVAGLIAWPALAQNIDFKTDIPQVPAEIKVFKLSPTKPPMAFVNETLRMSKLPPLTQTDKAWVSKDARVKDDPELVRAYVDAQSGDTYITPSTADLVAQPARALNAQTALMAARRVFTSDAFIPKDGTELKIIEPIIVSGGATTHPAAPTTNPRLATTAMKPTIAATAKLQMMVRPTAPRTVMVLVPAQRFAGGLPVFGRGSAAVITVAGDGTVAGALRRWRTADAGQTVKTELTAEQVKADILRQLKGKVPEGSTAVVDRAELSYYDRNEGYLTPTIRFEAIISPRDSKASPIRLEGFVPVVKAGDTVPDLAGPPQGEGPGDAKQPNAVGLASISPAEDAKLRAEIGGAGTPDDFTLGEYANQDWQNDGGYVDMSYAFLNGLKDKTSQVNRTQWYVAHNWEVVGPSSHYYMNAVNVAYTVPHGDWLFNTTDRNCCEGWYVPDIGTGGNPGFGHAAGNGSLATWVIMSCEVIPSYYDRLHEAGGSGNGYTAFDAWWPVFQGLHNVIGFRTIMFYPDDALNYGFGQHAGTGADINTAWFQEVAAHEGGVGTYMSQHLAGGPQVHYDRASTMIDARDLGHSIFHVTAQTASSTLWNFWMGN
jgi:hypothetical protein